MALFVLLVAAVAEVAGLVRGSAAPGFISAAGGGGAKDQEGKQAYVRCCSEQGKEQVGIGFGHCLARSIEQCKDV